MWTWKTSNFAWPRRFSVRFLVHLMWRVDSSLELRCIATPQANLRKSKLSATTVPVRYASVIDTSHP